ncbi:zinc finger protein 292 [Gastrophryne carolinensis]
MADGEAEAVSGLCPDLAAELPRLEERLQELESAVRLAGAEGGGEEEDAVQAASDYCQRFCQTLLEYAEKWKASEDSLPLLEVYMVAIQHYSKARPYLSSQCENVGLVLERLALSCVELLLCLPQELPDDYWQKFQGSIKAAHKQLTDNGSHELLLLYNMSQESGVWKDPVLEKLMNDEILDPLQAEGFLFMEGPLLLEMRIKRLLKLSKVSAATSLAKLCCDHPELSKKGQFMQLYLKCLCAASPNIKLIEEIAKVDCKDALEMICNLESEGDEKTSLILCAAFLSRQLQFGEMYCAWELTLFWSKLQRRVEPSLQVYLEICRQLSQLTKTVYHIFFLIKVIQSETEAAGLPTCIELCVRALRLESSENAKVKISICKTISCLLPDDLEVKRACQLTEFLLEPTVDAYYAVEMLYNQPDQKFDEESLPVPNSLRCELLLVLKTRWPFDPEFWDWKTLKRHCLALMGEQASIVSSIDELNDNEAYDQMDNYEELTKDTSFDGLDFFENTVPVQEGGKEKPKKKRPVKKEKEQGIVSARFRNWQAYMQYCVLCDKEFLGHRIIRHAQKHCIDGIYSCPICAKQYTTKETFIPHVTLHVKQSCKERLATLNPIKRLPKLPEKEPVLKPKKTETITKQERLVKKNSLYSNDFIVFNDNDNSDENEDKDQSGNFHPEKPASEFPCPVRFCNKNFKYFKNLIAHVRGHEDSEEATRFLEIQSKKAICQYCRRQFVSLTHLNDHLQMHCGNQPYICIQLKCKASFDSYADLMTHRKAHPRFKAKCMFPNCGRVFSAAYMLFDHEAQHYNTFTCKLTGCGKIFHSQVQLDQHLNEHATETRLPESSTSGTLSELTKGVIKSESVDFSYLPQMNTDRNINLDSSGKHTSSITKNPNVSDPSLLPQNATAVASSEMSNILDQIIPPVLPITNLLPQVLSSPTNTQSLVSKENMLVPSAFAEVSEHVKMSSVSEGFCDLLGQNKLPSRGMDSVDETQKLEHSGFEIQNTAVSHDEKKKCQDHISESLLNTLENHENKKTINPIMQYNIQAQASQLCENNLVIPRYEGDLKAENTLPLSIDTSNGLPNVLPPVCDSSATSVPPAPPERFKCNADGCTRIYNSIQSIGKHMKSAHPEHYPSFKAERRNRKRHKPGSLTSNEKSIYTILPGLDVPNNALQPHIQSTSNQSFCNQLQHLPNSVFPTHVENLVNPLLNPVETIMSQGIAKNVAETLLNSEVENFSNVAMTSQMEELAKVLPMKFENGSDPFLPMPTENDPLPVMSSLSGSTMFPQLGGSADHVLTGGEAANSVFMKDVSTEATFSKQVDSTDIDGSFNLEKSSTMLSNSGDQSTPGKLLKNKERRVKHSPRSKFPAIIKDGKFICSRCFRAFDNPRSLGGHLSKRAICKPHNDYGIPPPISHGNGQTSMLANMILSSSPPHKAQPLQQAFNPELSERHFTSSDQPESVQYMTPGFSHSSITLNSNEKSDTSVNQSFVNPENVKLSLPPNKLNECLASTPHIKTADPIHMGQTHALTTNSSLQEMPNLETVQTNSSNSIHLPVGEHLKSEPECTNALMNPAAENSNVANTVSSARVSVISGPRSSCITTAKRKNSTSKKKKKADTPEAVEATHELARNILAAVGENLQMSTQPNLMAYSSELLDNIAKHLSSADKELFMACLNESIKASSETPEVCQVAAKEESIEKPILPPYEPHPNESEKHDGHQAFKGETFGSFSPNATEVCSINSNVKISCSALPQTTVNGSIDDDIPGAVHSTSPSPLSTMNIPVCSVSPTQESNLIYDDQVLEIMDLIEKLQIVDCIIPKLLTIEKTETAPIISSVIVPNPSRCLVTDQPPEVSAPQVEKIKTQDAKPFVCQEEGCDYCAMTKDALFKHYTKVHYYTPEKLEQIKKHSLKFAPFVCSVPSCAKTFTRNSNLRAHCLTVHHFTAEDMIRLKLKRPFGKKSGSDNDFSYTEMPNGSPEAKKSVESYEPAEGQQKQETEIYQQLAPVKAHQSLETVDTKETSVSTTQELPFTPLEQKSRRGPKIKRKRKEKELMAKKLMLKEPKVNKGPTSYKPYRCVHQGCTAAFTIQQNLMLHYQSVHKSESSNFSKGKPIKKVEADSENGILQELRCTETDCSRIFASLGNLIQHYVKLHEMAPDEIENVISSLGVGQFNCDQSQCTSTFTSCLNYLEHLEEVHNIKTKQAKLDTDEMFKCAIKGCDRVYATRSNMLRHIFLKHKDKHKEHLIRPRKLGEQEIIEKRVAKEKSKITKQKSCTLGNDIHKSKKCKSSLAAKKTGPITLKCGKHTFLLKDREVALAEYSASNKKHCPCMISGCTSVITSERSLTRHYKTHKITRAFVSKHRKFLFLLKRRGRPPLKLPPSPNLKPPADTPEPDTKESPALPIVPHQELSNPPVQESGDESTISTSQQSENEKDEVDELAELFISKLSNEDHNGSESQARTSSCVSSDSQEIGSCQSESQRTVDAVKRTHKQKHATPSKKRKVATPDTLTAESSGTLSCEETLTAEPSPEDAPTFDLSSFKPMGFEVSFLKFIEASVVKEKPPEDKSTLKIDAQSEQENCVRSPRLSEDEDSDFDSDIYLLFANPSQLRNTDNIKIVLGEAFNDYIELVVRQLNELKPIVALKKRCVLTDEPASISEEQTVDLDRKNTL